MLNGKQFLIPLLYSIEFQTYHALLIAMATFSQLITHSRKMLQWTYIEYYMSVRKTHFYKHVLTLGKYVFSLSELIMIFPFFIKVMVTVVQGLIQPRNDSHYHFWVRKVWCPDSTFFSLSVLSKTVENENCI